jgi:type IV secretion system protein VirB6
MLIVYLAFYGVHLVMGTSRIGVAPMIDRALRMVFIVTLTRNWSYFNAFFYTYVNSTPKELERILLSITGVDVDNVTTGLSAVWKGANQAAGAFAQQTGFQAVLPSLVGMLIIAAALAFIAIALSILLLSKIMIWVLIGTAPIFIACMLFEQARGIAWAWLQQLLLYAMLPLFLSITCAFLITAIDPELRRVTNAATQKTLNLRDVAGFLVLCTAGALVSANMHALARGIANGVVVRLGGIARTDHYQTDFGKASAIDRISIIDRIYQGRRSLYNRFGGGGGGSISPTSQGAKEAMQNRISSNSLPR